jgi:hypothetical protein
MIDNGLTIILLLIIGVTGWKRAWVWRREVERAEKQLTDERIDFMRQLYEMKSERDEWRAMATRHPGPSERPLHVQED